MLYCETAKDCDHLGQLVCPLPFLQSSYPTNSYNPITFFDLPVTDLVRDDVTGDWYAAPDFGVMRLAAGTSSWVLATPGMPNVEVASLTIVPSAHKLYAATHSLSAWLLNLP
jgi:hypothetical protein